MDEITKEEIEQATAAGADGKKGAPPEVDASHDKSYTPPLGAPSDKNPKVYLDIAADGIDVGRIVIELKKDVAPK